MAEITALWWSASQAKRFGGDPADGLCLAAPGAFYVHRWGSWARAAGNLPEDATWVSDTIRSPSEIVGEQVAAQVVE